MSPRKDTIFEKTLDRTQNKYIRLRYNARNAAFPATERLKARIGAIPVRVALTVLDSIDGSISRYETAEKDRAVNQDALMSRISARQNKTVSQVVFDSLDTSELDSEIAILNSFAQIVDAEGARITEEYSYLHEPEYPEST